MKTFRTALLAAAALLTASSTAFASEWDIDPSHTASQFSVRHMMISTVRGQFGKTTGTVTLDDKDITKSKIDVTIDVASIDTREPKRDDHLRSPDFFDVANHPTMTFKSTKIVKSGRALKVTGDLTMRGVTKPVTLENVVITDAVKTPWGGLARGVTATGKLNRKDFGLTWNKALEAGGVLIGEEVEIVIDAELAPRAVAEN